MKLKTLRNMFVGKILSKSRLIKRLETNHRKGVELYADGRYRESEKQFSRNLELVKSIGPESDELLSYLKALGDFYHDTGNYSSAETPFMELLRISRKNIRKNPDQVLSALNDIALLLYAQGRYKEAEDYFRQLLEILEKQHPTSRRMATCLENYAAVLRRINLDKESQLLRERAKKIRDSL